MVCVLRTRVNGVCLGLRRNKKKKALLAAAGWIVTAEGKRARLTFTKNDLEALHLCICTQIISDSEVLNDIKHEYWRQQFAKCLDGLYDLAERIDKALRGVKGEDQKAD